MKLKTLATLTLSSIIVAGAFAQSQTFNIGAAGGSGATQTFNVESDAQFENFTGHTNKVSGSIKFDPAKGTGSGTMTIDLTSIDTGIALRNDHMRSAGWLDTEKFPKAVFVTSSVKKKSGDKYAVTGKLTLHGVTKTITTEVTARYLPKSAATQKAMFKGNVLNLKTAFNIKLADYGVKIPDMAKGKVAESVSIKLSVFGQTG